jgi:hypothetical protein
MGDSACLGRPCLAVPPGASLLLICDHGEIERLIATVDVERAVEVSGAAKRESEKDRSDERPIPANDYPVDLHQPADRRMRPFGISEAEEAEMKLSIAISAALIIGFATATTEKASAVVYCQYVEYPAGCVVRPGVAVPPTARKIPSSINARTSGFILRQDLFDRNNPNNLRSDWPGPPAQPGQF